MMSFHLMLFALCKTEIVELTLNRMTTHSSMTSLLTLASSSAESVRSFTSTVTVSLSDFFLKTMQNKTLQIFVNLELEK